MNGRQSWRPSDLLKEGAAKPIRCWMVSSYKSLQRRGSPKFQLAPTGPPHVMWAVQQHQHTSHRRFLSIPLLTIGYYAAEDISPG